MKVLPYVSLSLAFHNNSLESSWTEDSFGINVLLESSSAAEAALPDFRGVEVETELFGRIRNLEAQLAHRLPPQINAGDYERLVRENLSTSINLHHYRCSLSNELFEINIMELKAKLQNSLFNAMLAEPRIDVILNQSPFQDIRSEAFDFIESQVEPSMRHAFSRNILEGTLRGHLRDIEQNGTRSYIYIDFYSHFTDASGNSFRGP